ncbi:MAG: hypothetical protein ACC645_06280 [Pirellulales bacterium]
MQSRSADTGTNRVLLMTDYATGLRVSELIRLTPPRIKRSGQIG